MCLGEGESFFSKLNRLKFRIYEKSTARNRCDIRLSFSHSVITEHIIFTQYEKDWEQK